LIVVILRWLILLLLILYEFYFWFFHLWDKGSLFFLSHLRWFRFKIKWFWSCEDALLLTFISFLFESYDSFCTVYEILSWIVNVISTVLLAHINFYVCITLTSFSGVAFGIIMIISFCWFVYKWVICGLFLFMIITLILVNWFTMISCIIMSWRQLRLGLLLIGINRLILFLLRFVAF